MKARRVLLTLEVETSAPLPLLRNATAYAAIEVIDSKGKGWLAEVEQAQANVVKSAPKKGKRP